MTIDQDMLAALRTEAIDSAEDRIASLTDTVQKFQQGVIKGTDALASSKLDAHSLKSVAAGFEMKALKVMCHRMEDYLFNLSDLDAGVAKDIMSIIDRLSDCLDAFVNNREVDVSTMVRSLPMKGGFEIGDVSVTDIEVMLVMEPGTATRIVTRELLECGYRMVNVASTLDALHLIPSMKPDAVICSRHMPDLTGVDLACALRAMPTTHNIPVALIASVDRDRSEIEGLPGDVPLLRKGGNFADDVASVFVELGIL